MIAPHLLQAEIAVSYYIQIYSIKIGWLLIWIYHSRTRFLFFFPGRLWVWPNMEGHGPAAEQRGKVPSTTGWIVGVVAGQICRCADGWQKPAEYLQNDLIQRRKSCYRYTSGCRIIIVQLRDAHQE